MSTDARSRKALRLGIGLALLALIQACAPLPEMRGYNLLQDRKISHAHPQARLALERAQATGANTLAVVSFFAQPAANRPEIGPSDAVTMEQLTAAVRQAKGLGLRVILKPQILVSGAWAGKIAFESEADRQAWFTRYTELMIPMARLAEAEGCAALVVGTELTGLSAAPEWPALIAELRRHYSGPLSFAANGNDGVRRFAHWPLLDAVGVDLYPSLGPSGGDAEIRRRIAAQLAELEALARPLGRPIWILEIGHPSAQGMLERPWDWHALKAPGAVPDPDTQARVLGHWTELVAAKGRGIQLLLVWNWFSAPDRGGPLDVDYTPQNKPAEAVLRCRWSGNCALTGPQTP